MRYLVISLFLLLGAAAFACPELPYRSQERQQLLDDLAAADTHSSGIAAASAVWQFWHVAPDEPAQEMLNSGISRLRISDYISGQALLRRLADYCPNYAEGHNQLAFAYFLQGKMEQSLASIDRALELEPAHFGALTGKALIYKKQGRESLTQVYLRRAVAVNPWLNERHLLRGSRNLDEL
ncbi:MAG: tetratricopeptide repeat protein [Rhodobacteraceae bacterium]|nr:tetratricopeptide repeat protein [Paracoccaceae bacterium]